jgi:Family of unknown function (DUF6476)
MNDPITEVQPTPSPAGAILSDDQIRRLKWIVAAMTTVLILGVATLIGRVIYLANNRPEQGGIATREAALLTEATLLLPKGAALKTVTVIGNRLVAPYVSSSGEGVMILDLATGKTISHVRVKTGD